MKEKTKVKHVTDSHWGYILFMAWVGAAIYFVQQSDGFWGFILAILKAAVWPAYVLHAVLGILGVN